ncbi:hypothetical protein BH09BAC1_BH09BAC1_23950 [soil metagenome]
MEEISLVANRPHLKKYNTETLVEELMVFLDLVAEFHTPIEKHMACRDAKDNFLLDLIDISEADYLVTGDKDLLALDPFIKTRIVTPSEFEQVQF